MVRWDSFCGPLLYACSRPPLLTTTTCCPVLLCVLLTVPAGNVEGE
jgi:hypothetical protein